LLLGLLLLSYIDFPTFLVANIVVDVEPFLVLTLNLRYPLHGFFHSFLGGAIVAFLLAVVMNRLRNIFSPMLSYFRIGQKPSFKSVLSASLLGVYLHLLLDSPLYSDMQPLYPLSFNPFLIQDGFTSLAVYNLCILCFIGGGVVYIIRMMLQTRTTRNERN